MKDNFYTSDEVKNLGFKETGHNVLISRAARFYSIESIRIGNNVRIDDFCILSGEIKIGNYIHIGAGTTFIAGKAGIEMEDFSGTSHRVNIFAISDDFSGQSMIGPMAPAKYRHVKEGKVLLQKHSIIGCGSVILPNVTLGEGSAIGAMCLVTKSTQPWKIYLGIPARIIGARTQTVLEFEKELNETTDASNLSGPK
jgi:acetyltransferase-like isoleucine patch superfamily enzyme